MAIYESEHTKFIREWLDKHPEEREEQHRGRSLWWDKPISPDEAKRNAESRIAQKPYPYQSN